MSLVAVGLNGREAPLDLLERLAIGGRELPKALASLCDSPHLSEAAVLSTCLRTEVYAVLDRFHDGLEDVNAFFHERAGTSPAGVSALEEHLTVYYDDAAARHLFEVAAGADSAVLGEGEILRQVRDAGEQARTERASGPVLGGLFRHAVEVGKRARSETGIARGVTSLAHVAVALAAERLGDGLGGARVLLVGTGKMGEQMASALGSMRGRPEVVVLSRSRARAERLAAGLGARAAELDALERELGAADLLLSATSAPGVLLDASAARRVLRSRGGRPLLVVDAAVPRDVDPEVGRLDGVTLVDIDALGEHAEAGVRARRGEVERVREIVEEELERYRTQVVGRSAAPVISSLRAAAEQIRQAELQRMASRLERLDPADRKALESFSRRLVAKLLHEPTVQLKLAAGSARGERLAEALRQLFDL